MSTTVRTALRRRTTIAVCFWALATTGALDSLLIHRAFAQSFQEQTGIRLADVSASAVAWGDYNNDGHLDLALSGWGTNFTAALYRNNWDNTFTELPATPFYPVFSGSIAWGDYDRDGWIDLLWMGKGLSGPRTVVYRNARTGEFLEAGGITLTGLYAGAALWADFDNDGDLDILITGWTAANAPATKLYENRGTFVERTATGLVNVGESSAAVGDYDNDGKLDILLTGSTSYTSLAPVSRLFRNQGSFVFAQEPGATLTGVALGECAWGDYDNDGDLDILLTGYTGGSVSVSKVYQNNGNRTFTERTSIVLTPVDDGAALWGDYDNDGRLDILLAGWAPGPTRITKLYRNNGNHTFTDQPAALLPGLSDASAAWGDYDGDGDLDLVLTGLVTNGPTSRVYRNQAPLSNRRPAAPQNLSALRQSSQILFSWTAPTDHETPRQGLSYNLRIGTALWGGEVLSPMASLAGTRRVVSVGPIQGTNWTLNAAALTNSVYYWSVQAIDTAFAGSPFGLEHIFTGTTDTDLDGLGDTEELRLGTNPTRVDSDNDNLSDAEEVYFHGTNPLEADSDADGLSDGAEAVADTSPLNRDSLLVITGLSLTNGNANISWKSGSLATHVLETATQESGWAPILTNPSPTWLSSTTSVSVLSSVARFYRIRAEGMPGPRSGQTVVLTKQQSGQTMSMPQGATLQVLLRGCPSIGYSWQVATNNSAVLEMVESTFEDDQPPRLGGCGTFKFTFMPVAPGQTPLQLNYQRSGDLDPTDQFLATIQVNP